MAVTKYRDISEMPPLQRATGDRVLERMARAWEMAHVLHRPIVIPGVRKFRTIEKAQQARQAAETQRARKFRNAST